VQVRYSKAAQTALFRSHKRALIRAKIEAFATEPDLGGPNVTRLKGREEYRLRVQDWRVIFVIDEDYLTVRDIGPRGSIYDG
jgi:mRNA interferase RelE/StbE